MNQIIKNEFEFYWFFEINLLINYFFRSPHHTVEIFKTIKSSFDEPEVSQAIAAGTSTSSSTDDSEYNSSETAQEILLSLPGITIHNFRKVMDTVDSISELTQLSCKQLISILGNTCGKQLYFFFHQQR